MKRNIIRVAVSFLALVPFVLPGLAVAALQTLGLVATNGPVELKCEAGYCKAEFSSFCQTWQGSVIGTALPALTDYRQADWSGPMVLLMGNEQSGLSEEMMELCTQLVRLPMKGRSDSLNLAVATGICLYEVLKV